MTNIATNFEIMRELKLAAVKALQDAADTRTELKAAHRLIWTIAKIHGGTITIARASLESFDPAGSLKVSTNEFGSAVIEAVAGPGVDLPPVVYSWDK